MCSFAKAFEHIKLLNLNIIEVGKYEVEGEALFFTVSNKPGILVEEAIAKFECHNNYIDNSFVYRVKNRLAGNHAKAANSKKKNIKKEKILFFIMMFLICIFN